MNGFEREPDDVGAAPLALRARYARAQQFGA